MKIGLHLFFLLGLMINQKERLIFNGNSHFNLGMNSITEVNSYYVPIEIYNTIKSTYPCAMVAFAVGGNPTTTMNANFATQNAVVIRKGDIVILFEITNDLSVNKLSGEQAYKQLVEFADNVHRLGGYIIVGTTIARNHSNDPIDIWTRGQACNTLIRNAPAGIFDAICDLGADSYFNEERDCENRKHLY
jgi:hypothetical protein